MTDYSTWTSEDFEAILEQSSFLSQHEARALLDRHIALEKELVDVIGARMRSLEKELRLGARVAELEAYVKDAAGVCQWGCVAGDPPPCLTCRANALLAPVPNESEGPR